MLRSLIAFCLSRRLLVLVSFAAFLGLGMAAATTLNIEAYPDPAPPIIEIIAQYPGQSPEEVERYVTIPIEIALSSTPGLKYVRSNTVYALGFLRLQFEYGVDYNFARQQTINRLKDATLPQGVQPVISPAGGISEIMRFQLVGPPDMDLLQLKTIEDWVVERRLRIVPGVADISSLGGKTKEYQAEIDLNKMMSYGLTLPQIITALSVSNSNVGGRTIALGEQSVNVRGIGVIGSVGDIEKTVLTQHNGVPVLLSDVARVQIGYTPRLGIAGRDDKTDVIFGIVLMQKLERTMDVIRRVHTAIDTLNSDGSLPPGVKVVPFYDRGELVAITVRTVLHNLLFGIALIFLIQYVFLGNLRCAIIVAATMPAALFLAVIITVVRGEFRQPAFGRRDRSRHHRRCDRDHGGEHLPPPGASRSVYSRRRQPIDAQAQHHPRRRRGGRPSHSLLGHHHHRRVSAAVHHARRRGADLRPDVAHVRLRAAGCRHRHLHRYAGAVVAHPARSRRRDRDVRRAADTAHLYAPAPSRGGQRQGRCAYRPRLPGVLRHNRFASRHRVPAEARGRQHVGACAAAAHHHAACRDRFRRAHAQDPDELRAGAHGRLGAGAQRGCDRSGRLLRRRISS